MLVTTPYAFMWKVQNPQNYWADNSDEVKYYISLNGKILGEFMGVNRSFDDDMYYVNYINDKKEYESNLVAKNIEIILIPMKCKWCTEDGWCELRDGIADDNSCNGTPEEMRECNYIDNPDYVE